jgi:hypothetical protein
LLSRLRSDHVRFSGRRSQQIQGHVESQHPAARQHDSGDLGRNPLAERHAPSDATPADARETDDQVGVRKRGEMFTQAVPDGRQIGRGDSCRPIEIGQDLQGVRGILLPGGHGPDAAMGNVVHPEPRDGSPLRQFGFRRRESPRLNVQAVAAQLSQPRIHAFDLRQMNPGVQRQLVLAMPRYELDRGVRTTGQAEAFQPVGSFQDKTPGAQPRDDQRMGQTAVAANPPGQSLLAAGAVRFQRLQVAQPEKPGRGLHVSNENEEVTVFLRCVRNADQLFCYAGAVMTRFPPRDEVAGIRWWLTDRDGWVIGEGATETGGHFGFALTVGDDGLSLPLGLRFGDMSPWQDEPLNGPTRHSGRARLTCRKKF